MSESERDNTVVVVLFFAACAMVAAGGNMLRSGLGWFVLGLALLVIFVLEDDD